jgi:hypothetical protein
MRRRQLECIVLVAQGKSDWEVGRLLGLSKSTARIYRERETQIRRRLARPAGDPHPIRRADELLKTGYGRSLAQYFPRIGAGQRVIVDLVRAMAEEQTA